MADNRVVDDTLRNITPEAPAAESDATPRTGPGAADRERHEYAAMLGDLPIGVLGLDYDGRVTFINDAARRFLDIPAGPNRGRPIDELIAQPDVLAHIHDAIEYSRDGYPIVREFRCGEATVELRSSFTGDAARISSTVITLENVSYRNEIAERKDEFLSLVSHELRTPLTVIRGYLDLFVRGLMGEMNEEQLDCTRLMLQQCVKLEELIRDLVRFRNIARGVARSGAEPLVIGPAVREAVAGLIDDIGHARMRLVIDVEDGNLSAWCSYERFQTAIRHLVDNAIKFAGAGCTVRISAGEFDLSDLPPLEKRVVRRDPPPHTRWAAVSVTDDGPGIPEDKRNAVFETFQQGEPHLTRRTRGLGLGLPLVREIVDSSGGTLWLDDAVEKGTRITFILPLIHGQVDEAESTHPRHEEITP